MFQCHVQAVANKLEIDLSMAYMKKRRYVRSVSHLMILSNSRTSSEKMFLCSYDISAYVIVKYFASSLTFTSM